MRSVVFQNEGINHYHTSIRQNKCVQNPKCQKWTSLSSTTNSIMVCTSPSTAHPVGSLWHVMVRRTIPLQQTGSTVTQLSQHHRCRARQNERGTKGKDTKHSMTVISNVSRGTPCKKLMSRTVNQALMWTKIKARHGQRFHVFSQCESSEHHVAFRVISL